MSPFRYPTDHQFLLALDKDLDAFGQLKQALQNCEGFENALAIVTDREDALTAFREIVRPSSADSIASFEALPSSEKFAIYRNALLSTYDSRPDNYQVTIRNLCAEQFSELATIFAGKFVGKDKKAEKERCALGIFNAFIDPKNFSPVDQVDRQATLSWLHDDFRIEEFLLKQTDKMMIHHSLAFNDLPTANFIADKIYDSNALKKAFSFVDDFGGDIFLFTARGIIRQENSNINAEYRVLSFVLKLFADLEPSNKSLLRKKLDVMSELLSNQIYLTLAFESERSIIIETIENGR